MFEPAPPAPGKSAYFPSFCPKSCADGDKNLTFVHPQPLLLCQRPPDAAVGAEWRLPQMLASRQGWKALG